MPPPWLLEASQLDKLYFFLIFIDVGLHVGDYLEQYQYIVIIFITLKIISDDTEFTTK